MRAYFRFARCKYVPTILSESLAQAGVAGTLRAKTERKIWITYSGLPSPARDVTGKIVLIHFAEKKLSNIIIYSFLILATTVNGLIAV